MIEPINASVFSNKFSPQTNWLTFVKANHTAVYSMIKILCFCFIISGIDYDKYIPLILV